MIVVVLCSLMGLPPFPFTPHPNEAPSARCCLVIVVPWPSFTGQANRTRSGLLEDDVSDGRVTIS